MISEFLTFIDVVEKSTKYLSKRGVPNPKNDVEWIISNITKKSKLDIYLDFEKVIDNISLKKIREDIIKRGKRIPLQHIIGTITFAGNELFCDKRALIPRPETEYFCELINKRIKTELHGEILDLGTGSGAIILALCKGYNQRLGVGIDKCKKAIELAQKNIDWNNANNITLLNFDWKKQNLDKQYNIIVSNPPYLTEEEWNSAEPEVKIFDPKIALVSNENGLSDINIIIKHSIKHIIKDGIFAIEIGIDQQNFVEQNLKKDFYQIEVIKDFSQNQRFVIARKK